MYFPGIENRELIVSHWELIGRTTIDETWFDWNSVPNNGVLMLRREGKRIEGQSGKFSGRREQEVVLSMWNSTTSVHLALLEKSYSATLNPRNPFGVHKLGKVLALDTPCKKARSRKMELFVSEKEDVKKGKNTEMEKGNEVEIWEMVRRMNGTRKWWRLLVKDFLARADVLMEMPKIRRKQNRGKLV